MSTANAVPTPQVNRPGLNGRIMNPYSRAGQVKATLNTTPTDIYEDLKKRTSTVKPSDLSAAIATLKAKLNGSVYSQTDFGELRYVDLKDLYVNVDNQRDIDWPHIFYILGNFDPRIVQVINVIELPDGRLSIPEGQHTAVVLFILYHSNLLPRDFKVMVKVIDHALAVPGSTLTGEAFGNLLFRVINHKGRKEIAAYYLFRSRVNGVRLYGSNLQEDVHAEEIQQVLERNNMFASPAHLARARGATPGMVTYISGLLDISEHDTAGFAGGIKDLDWCLRMHDQCFYREKGVDGGFILAFGRYAKLAREQNVTIDKQYEQDFMDFFQSRYGSPKMFHDECKTRLRKFQRANTLPETWTDACLRPVLIMDFDAWCKVKNKSYTVLNDLNTKKFYGM